LNDDVVTKALVFTVGALPVFTVTVNWLPLALWKVIILLDAEAVTTALEADVLRLLIDVFVLLVKLNILELNAFTLPVKALKLVLILLVNELILEVKLNILALKAFVLLVKAFVLEV
jgi:hypothetical protein